MTQWTKESVLEKMAYLRDARRISQRELSDILGFSESYIGKVENQSITLSVDLFLNILKALDVTPQDFFEEGKHLPNSLSNLVSVLETLDEDSIQSLTTIAKKLKK